MHSIKATWSLSYSVDLKNIDIMMVQEPYIKGNKVCGFPNQYKVFYGGNTRPRAAIILANSSINGVLISDFSSDDFTVIEISYKHYAFILVCAYFDIDRDIEVDIDES